MRGLRLIPLLLAVAGLPGCVVAEVPQPYGQVYRPPPVYYAAPPVYAAPRYYAPPRYYGPPVGRPHYGYRPYRD